MKRITFIIFLGIVSLISSAQPGQFPPERISQEEIIRMQTMDIVSWMDFDKKTKERFIREYSAFRKEIDAVAKNARPPQDIKSEEEIEKAIMQNFAVSEQILRIRKKFYAKFKEFMKPSQIQMMYRIENEAGRRMHDGPDCPDGPRPDGPDGPDGRPIPHHHR